MNPTQTIQAIMHHFAERTGLTTSNRTPIRYLWTDAFAVCNFLELFQRIDDESYLNEALALVDQVHQVLGQHREDDLRQGWISGLSPAEGVEHPTQGGLRIGKQRPERSRNEPFNERLEWDRDGQYFHYLTKWMHALDRVAHTTRNPNYIQWALELAKSVHAAFVYQPKAGGGTQMVWKMSIDLSYPLVPSMGHHDPLDGLVTYLQIHSSATDFGLLPEQCDLGTEIAEMSTMCEGVSWQTADTLGIGGLLIDACQLAQLIAVSNVRQSQLLEFLLDEAAVSLHALAQMATWNESAEYRLAFRELGLSIGLHGTERIQTMMNGRPANFPNRRAIHDKLSNLRRFDPWSDMIEAFWLDPDNQGSDNWRAHQDINSVMLATSLTRSM